MAAGPLILGIETATPCGGAALAAADGSILDHQWERAEVGRPRRLLPMLDGALARLGAGKRDIAAVAVTRGPGSFTGVRTGLATAKTLAGALGVPLYLFSTLECAARRTGVTGAPVCAVLDARRGEIYSGIYLFRDAGGGVEVIRPPAVEPLAALLEHLEAAGAGEIWFTGDGAEAGRETIHARLGARARWVEPPLNRPGADIVAAEGARALAAGAPACDPMTAVPEYLRASDAERNLARRTT